MGVVKRSELRQFNEAKQLLANRTRKRLEALLAAALAGIDMNNIASTRNTVIAVMEGVLSEATDASAVLSASFYDLVRERSIGASTGALALSGRKKIATQEFVRAEVGNLLKYENVDAFIGACLLRSDYEVKKAAGDCVYLNGYRDTARVLYARVPGGEDTCAFCNMLASRGPVYRSAESAGADDPDHYHANCQCEIVPMFDSVYQGQASRMHSLSTSVEGYDPDALYDQYLKDIDSGVLNRDGLAKAAERAHAANAHRYEVVL